MPKITDYDFQTPDILDAVVIAYNSLNYFVVSENLSTPVNHQYMNAVFSDFIGWSVNFYPQTGGEVVDLPEHPGIWRGIFGATMDVNLPSSHLLTGGEVVEAIFSVVDSTNVTALFGLVDSGSAPVDGAWINISGTTLTGKTSNNSAVSTTASSYVLTAGNWYRSKVVVNSAANQVDFYLYSDTGDLLWSASLTTNIPTAAGRETNVRFYVSVSAGAGEVYLDWAAFYIMKQLVR